MEKTLSRRNFAAAVVGTAAVAAAVPAVAQRRAMMPGMASITSLTAGNWMQQVKAQHLEIVRHFQMLKRPMGAPGRMAGLMSLKNVLTAHSIAEETSIYPAIALTVDRGGADMLYKEQQDAKVMLADIDNMMAMDPRADYMGKLTALESAVTAHAISHEESDLYPKLMRSAPAPMNAKVTKDFREAFTRYYNG